LGQPQLLFFEEVHAGVAMMDTINKSDKAILK